MRKAGLVVLVAVTCIATFSDARAVRFGVRVGASYATQDLSYPNWQDPETDWRLGLRAGVFAEWHVAGWVSLVGEANYVQKGTEWSESDTYGSRLDYVSLPVLAKLTIYDGDPRPYLAFGPRIDFLIGKEVHEDLESTYESLDSTDLGGDVALGFEFGRFGVEARYCASFTDGFPKSILEATNRAIGLTMGYTF